MIPATSSYAYSFPRPRSATSRSASRPRLPTDSVTEPYTGTVSFVASEAEFTPTNVETKDQRTKLVFEVRVRISDTSGALKAGMPVDVTFQ